eukprot:11043986-Karenia_brevis.AAC.1
MPPPPAPPQLDDDEIEEVWQKLLDKRVEWAGQFEQEGDDFEVHMRGGLWTRKHKGVVTNEIRGACSTSDARAFCSLYKLPQSITFSIAKYGEFESS